jgi:hypothetical protein
MVIFTHPAKSSICGMEANSCNVELCDAPFRQVATWHTNLDNDKRTSLLHFFGYYLCL